MAYIGSKPANKPVVASDLDPAVITGQTALATSPADTDEFLISDAGVLKRLDASLIGGDNTPAFSVKSNGAKTLANTTITKLSFGTEVFDTDSAFASDKFTVPSGKDGKYVFYASWQTATSTDFNEQRIYIYKNGSAADPNIQGFHNHYGSIQITKILDLSATDYIEVYAYQNSGGSVNTLNTEIFQGYKLI